MLIRPSTPTPRAIASVASRIRSISRVAERDRRQRAGRVAGVDAGLLDVLHHAAEEELVAVEDRVDVDLDRVVDEPVDQHRVLGADLGRPVDVALERPVVVHDLHAAAAQHVRRAHQHRVADLGRDRRGLVVRRRHAVQRRGQARPRRAPARRRRAPRRGGSPRGWCRRSGRRRPRAPAPARAASGRRAGRSRRRPDRPSARRARSRGRPRGSAARSRAGRRCRSRWRRSRGCS